MGIRKCCTKRVSKQCTTTVSCMASWSKHVRLNLSIIGCAFVTTFSKDGVVKGAAETSLMFGKRAGTSGVNMPKVEMKVWTVGPRFWPIA